MGANMIRELESQSFPKWWLCLMHFGVGLHLVHILASRLLHPKSTPLDNSFQTWNYGLAMASGVVAYVALGRLQRFARSEGPVLVGCGIGKTVAIALIVLPLLLPMRENTTGGLVLMMAALVASANLALCAFHVRRKNRVLSTASGVIAITSVLAALISGRP